MTNRLSVLLIGAGAMGGAMLRGWLAADLLDISRSAVVDPQISPELLTEIETRGLALNPETDQPWDICVLAIKPQLFASILPSLSWPDIGQTLFVSVAAGKSVQSIRTHLKEIGAGDADIIRAMPNLPVSVGKGVTLLFAEESVTEARRKKADQLAAASGMAVWLDREEEIDAGMSVSACGPAYVFLLAEAMAEAGIRAGLSPEVAEALARQTVIGGGALLEADPRKAADLRQSVMSPGARP